ncbi:hypothetical protein E2320_005213 [Naja naja]|nr:hypothetical protein E2320_005213 [Naja naja]
MHGHTGNQIILSAPKYSTKPFYLIWTKNSTFIAEYLNNNITLSTKQPEPNKYYLFLNGSLKINRLKKMDAGNYEVKAYKENGIHLSDGLITLQVDGSVSINDKMHGHTGNQIILSAPKYSTKPFYLIWTKNSTFIAEYLNNNITLSTKQPEPNKYYLFLNGSLKINRLKKMDAGNYEVKAYKENGIHLSDGLITLQVDGSVSINDKMHGHTGNQIILSAPKYSTKPFYLIWTKNSTFIAEYLNNNITLSTKQPEPNKYYLFLNGSLKINRLKKMDAGNYEVKAYKENGIHLSDGLITLQVDELQPKLSELCPQRTLTCEVKYSEKPKPRFKLFQDTKEIETLGQPVYDNATWKVTLPLKVHSGKFRCEIDVNSDKNHIEKQITCSGEDLLNSKAMFLIPITAGSIVALIIGLALIIYFIRRKKAKRCEREAEEYALQIQINNHLQQRKLPEIPVYSGSNPSSQKNRPPPSQLQQQIGPSKSCPHPKPPRR